MSVEARIARIRKAVQALAGPAPRPADRSALARAMADGSLPVELGALYQITDGLVLPEADVWDLPDLLGFAGRDPIARNYPGGAAFGGNRADRVFVLDAADTMHAGPGAVLSVDSTYPGPESAVLCTPDLARFLDLARAGQTPWRGPKLVDVQAAQLAELIARRPDRVDARAPLPPAERMARIARAEVAPGAELLAFLSIADGLRFARSGLVIAGAAELAPLPGGRLADGRPWLIRIGRVPKGPDLVVTAPGGPRPSDLVLQLAPGGDPQAAPSFGRLLPTLIGWIASDAENAP